MKRLYRNARIAREDSPRLEEADVLVEGDRITGVAPSMRGVTDCVEIDCAGAVLLPALFDLHVHAREPGQEEKENIASCAEAAINGGITGFVMMPDTAPAVDGAGTLRSVLESARRSRLGQGILAAGAITKGRLGQELAGIASMKAAGCVLLSDGGPPVDNPQVLRRAMEYAREFDLPVASHGEVRELSGKGCMHEGRVSYALGLPGIPSISEEIGIARDIRLAEFTGVHLHVQQVSTAKGLATIRRAKERGIRVTCEVSPHHLIFHHESVGDYDTNFKVNPPLRTPEDNAALIEGLREGWIDAVASGHAPHTPFEKNQDFASAPFGITGLETALVSLHHHFITPGSLDWGLLVRRCSAEPRRLLGLPPVPVQEGGVAEFVVFQPQRQTVCTRGFLQSRSSNTPFLDRSLTGCVERVISRGVELLAR